MSMIGKSTVRTDGTAKVCGEAIYTTDYAEPNMLHGRLLRSPVAAGKLVRLDTSAAKLMPGVKAILTAEDIPDNRSGMLIEDRPIFARERVRFIGEPIAAVAAETRAQAEAAIEKIDLEIAESTPVEDVHAALEGDAEVIHPEISSYGRHPVIGEKDIGSRGNILSEVIVDHEGIDEIFDSAHLVVEDVFESARQYQAYLEPKAAVGSYRNGRYIIRCGSQWPFAVRDELAKLLDVKPSAIQLINLTIGGAFGAKLEPGLEAYAAILAKASGQTVKLVNTLPEDMLTSNARENAYIRIRTAVDEDGNILARDFYALQDSGAYASETPVFPSVAAHLAGGAYNIPAVRVTTRSVYTNTAPTGAFRGVAGVYVYNATEQHIDNVARKLGMDRREFRLKNIMRSGDKLFNGQTHPHADILMNAFDEVEKIAPWSELNRDKGSLRGIAICAAYWMNSGVPGGATVRLNEDGTVRLLTAANENGAGPVAMALTQVVAEELSVPIEDVLVPTVDTDTCVYEGGSQGSRTTPITGEACRRAACELRDKVLQVASGLLQADVEQLELCDAMVGIIGKPDSRIPLAMVAGMATFEGVELTGVSSYAGPQAMLDNPAGHVPSMIAPGMAMPNYHVHLAEVEVDPVTGNTTVVRYVVAQDVGKVINPGGVFGQIQGAVTQGIGFTLYESMRLKDCKPVECSFEAYRLPLALDIPRVEAILIESGTGAGPYGAKGVAEPPILLNPSVIANAIADALGKDEPFGRLPITPEDVLAEIMKQEAFKIDQEAPPHAA